MSGNESGISADSAERFEAGMKEFLRLQEREKELVEEVGKLTKSVRLAELERDKLTLDLQDAQIEVAKARAEAETALIARVRYEEGLESIRQTLARLRPEPPVAEPPGGGVPFPHPEAPLPPAEYARRLQLDSLRVGDTLRPPVESPDAPHVRVEEVTRAADSIRKRERLPRGYEFEPIEAPRVDLDRFERELSPPPIPRRLVVYQPQAPMREPGFIDKISDFAARLARRPVPARRHA